MTYHAYIDGYSVLPALRPLADERVFFADEHLADYLEEKRKAFRTQQVFFQHEIAEDIYQAVCDFILAQMPHLIPSDFSGLAMQLQEDIAIHRFDGAKDWLAACHICFPSSWLPEEKIGRSFHEIHQPVPGFNLNASEQLVRAMICRGPFLRYVWSPIGEKRINFHPSIPPGPTTGVYVKIERQVIWPFPELNAALFVIRQQLILDPDVELLNKAITAMSDAEKQYKNVTSLQS